MTHIRLPPRGRSLARESSTAVPGEPALPLQLLELQRQHGNQAVLRFVAAQAPPARLLQRTITIMPAHYARGLGVTPATLSDPQLSEYLRMAVDDDVEWARQRAHEVGDDGAIAAWNRLLAMARDTNLPMQERVLAVEGLIRAVNGYPELTAARRKTGNEEQDDKRRVVRPPNRETRYATEPSDEAYVHDTTAGATPSPEWGDDKTMWEEFGTGFGPLRAGLGTTKPKTKGEIALTQITWAQANRLLPRPLLNLIFDVRFQLESRGDVVVDERSRQQRTDKDKSPNEPGTLRSWHQDSFGVLPANEFKKGVPADAAPLHQHYTATSQAGAGGSIGTNPIKSPEGYAEYTGTGSDWEHNTKVVLDYIAKRVYLTLTHYSYWALIETDGGGHEFFNTETHDAGQAEGKLADRVKKLGRKPEHATMMNPWVEVLVT